MKKINILLIFIALLAYSCSSEDSLDEQDMTITPNVGVANITFEDDGNKVIEEYGTYERLTSVGTLGLTAFVMWYENGLAFQLDSVETRGITLQEIVDRSDELINLDNNVITMVIMSPYEASTAEGVGMGSSRSEVVEVYGEPDRTFGSADLYDNINMGFSYNSSDIVTRIDLFSK